MVLETIKGKLNVAPEENLHQEEDRVIPVSEYRTVLMDINRAVELGGYNSISQIMGFILSEDPTHIANFGNARNLIGKIDRDELLEDMVKYYLGKTCNEDN